MNTKETVASTYCAIEIGPNRDTLFDACKYAFDARSAIYLDFVIKGDLPDRGWTPLKPVIDIKVSSIRHVEYSATELLHALGVKRLSMFDCFQTAVDSANEFLVSGHCRADLVHHRKDSSSSYRPYDFEAKYNSRSRRGFIRLFEPSVTIARHDKHRSGGE